MVQTFLPYPDFAASARALDDRRLGKQRVEALQILRAQVREGYGWQHHPAVRMWRGHPEGVAAYPLAICEEWAALGKVDTVAESSGRSSSAVSSSPRRRRPAWCR